MTRIKMTGGRAPTMHHAGMRRRRHITTTRRECPAGQTGESACSARPGARSDRRCSARLRPGRTTRKATAQSRPIEWLMIDAEEVVAEQLTEPVDSLARPAKAGVARRVPASKGRLHPLGRGNPQSYF